MPIEVCALGPETPFGSEMLIFLWEAVAVTGSKTVTHSLQRNCVEPLTEALIKHLLSRSQCLESRENWEIKTCPEFEALELLRKPCFSLLERLDWRLHRFHELLCERHVASSLTKSPIRGQQRLWGQEREDGIHRVTLLQLFSRVSQEQEKSLPV